MLTQNLAISLEEVCYLHTGPLALLPQILTMLGMLNLEIIILMSPPSLGH
jgi:hypothetical protein